MVISVTEAPRARIEVKGRVSWCIQEGNLLAIFHDLVGTDMLSDSSCFTCRYTRITKGIQKVVLPWSTCPMMVTTGGRSTKSSGFR